MLTYQIIKSSVSQVFGLLAWRGHDSRLFSSILSSADLFFSSNIFFLVYHLKTGSRSIGFEL